MKIDAHLHIHENFSVAELIRYLDKEGFDGCWLLSWEESPEVPWPYLPLTVEAIAEAHAQYPERIFPMYAPDPLQKDCVEKFRSYYHLGFRGCAELKTAIKWNDPRLQPLLIELNRLKLPLTFHMEEARDDYRLSRGSAIDKLFARIYRSNRLSGVPRHMLQTMTAYSPRLQNKRDDLAYHFPGYMMDVGGLEAALQRYPDIRFVGHGPFFWKSVADPPGAVQYPLTPYSRKGEAWRLLQTYPNLFADLSGRSGYCMLKRDRRQAREFVTAFADKLLYGSDNFFADQEKILSDLKLEAGAYRKIYGENALMLTGAASPNNSAS